MKKCEWHLAGMIICDDCGQDTFFRCVILPEAHETQAHIVRPPNTVRCVHCGTEFDVESDAPKKDAGQE